MNELVSEGKDVINGKKGGKFLVRTKRITHRSIRIKNNERFNRKLGEGNVLQRNLFNTSPS